MKIEHGIIHDRSQKLIDHAFRFAMEAHGDQKRKYTDEPYIVHPVAVARLVASVTPDCEAICAALLHDVIEDTPVAFEDIVQAGFGWTIANLVSEVTDVSRPEDGNRAIRKALDRQHLAQASARGKTIKLADLIDNTKSISEHDRGFANIYLKEKRALMEVLVGGDETLYAMAMKQIAQKY